MKFAREVMELMGSYPGREFRMIEIIRYVANGKDLTQKQRSAMHVGVHRVLKELEATGTVDILRGHRNGGYALYRWRKTIT